MKTAPLALVLLLIHASTGASGETVYRCGADRNVYRAEPCPEGVRIDTGEEPGDQRRREAEALARRDAAVAKQLARERKQRESEATPSLAVGIRGERGSPIEPSAGSRQKVSGSGEPGRATARKKKHGSGQKRQSGSTTT